MFLPGSVAENGSRAFCCECWFVVWFLASSLLERKAEGGINVADS